MLNMVEIKRREEEVRKIQFSGKSSYTLALPKKWIEQMGLMCTPHNLDSCYLMKKTSFVLLTQIVASFEAVA